MNEQTGTFLTLWEKVSVLQWKKKDVSCKWNYSSLWFCKLNFFDFDQENTIKKWLLICTARVQYPMQHNAHQKLPQLRDPNHTWSRGLGDLWAPETPVAGKLAVALHGLSGAFSETSCCPGSPVHFPVRHRRDLVILCKLWCLHWRALVSFNFSCLGCVLCANSGAHLSGEHRRLTCTCWKLAS